jgi:hypothetical protein
MHQEVLYRLQQIGDFKLARLSAGLLKSRTPAHLRQNVPWAEHRLAHRCGRQGTHPVLTIERAHVGQPVEEFRVVRERHASLRAGDEEVRGIHRRQGTVIVAHR